MLRKQGDNHKFAWLRNTGLGFVGDEKTLMYVLNARVFKTSKGKDMANMYCWDGRNIFKIVVFPHIVRKVKPLIKSDEWFAVRLDKIEDKNSLSRLDSYKLSSDSAIITVNNYIDRKNLVVPT
jgi:DNA polymerase III alpha subunit